MLGVISVGKRSVLFLFRIAMICGICAALYFGWYALENRGAVNDAEFIFAGTKNDADCAILLSEGYCVVVDTGEAQDAPHIVELLKEHEVETIDCLVLTHPDQDHVGGAQELVRQFAIKQVVVPYFSGEKAVYQTLMNEIQRESIPVLMLYRDRQFIFGDLDIRIFPPEDFYYAQTNDYSLAILLEHGDNCVFMAGDAEKTRLNELLNLNLPTEIDLYKAAHHGRDSTKGVALIEKLQPQKTVVTAKQAESRIQMALEQVGSEVFYTVGQDVTFISDGTSLEVLESSASTEMG